VHLLRGEAVSP